MGILEVKKIILLIMYCARLSTSEDNRWTLRKNSQICNGLGSSCSQDSECCGDDTAITVRCETRRRRLGARCYKIGRNVCVSDNDCVSHQCVDGRCMGRHYSKIGL